MSNNSSNDSNDEPEAVRTMEKSSNSNSAYSTGNDESVDNKSHTEPDEIPERDLDRKKINDFFEKKGAVEILAQLAEEPKRFSQIDNALVVSHGTIANRLTDGVKLNLWKEYFHYPDDGGKIKLYQLNPEAQDLAKIAQHENIAETMEHKRQATEQHDEAVSNFQDKITAGDSEE